jgi:hypothetical protein
MKTPSMQVVCELLGDCYAPCTLKISLGVCIKEKAHCGHNKANTEEIKEKLRSIDIEKQLKEQDLTVDQLWNNFKEKVLDIMNQSMKNKSRMDFDFSVK